MGRAPCYDKTGVKRGPWTLEEDKKLLAYIEQHGLGNWRSVPVNAGLQRCGKSCRLPWTNYLRPDIKRGKFRSWLKLRNSWPKQTRQRTATTALSTKARPSQGHTSKSGQAKLWTDNTSEENKSKSSWKNSWLFWQRSKSNDSVNAYSSTRKSSSNSGPIYSDGLPLRPANRSRSGSLSGSATLDRSYGIESPHEQLNSKAHSTYRHLYKV